MKQRRGGGGWPKKHIHMYCSLSTHFELIITETKKIITCIPVQVVPTPYQSTFPTVNARGKNTYQITGIRTNTRSTHSILYKVVSLKWSKNAHPHAHSD